MGDSVSKFTGFILTRGWRDTNDGLEYVFWLWSSEGPLRIHYSAAEAVCFVEREAAAEANLPAPDRRRAVALNNLAGAAVDACYFRRQSDLIQFRDSARMQGVAVHESDIKPADRHLMERFVTGGCEVEGVAVSKKGYLEFNNPQIRPAQIVADLKIASIDIETADFDGALFSIAVSAVDDETVFVVEPELNSVPSADALVTALDGGAKIVYVDSEKAALTAFYAWLAQHDPDVLVGWNVVAFDLDFIEKRSRQLGLDFAAGRGAERATILNPQGRGDTYVARVPGRVVLDGIDTLRAAFYNFEDFSLEAVANELLGRGKLIKSESNKVAEINRLYREDKVALAAYNLEDCRLVREIFDATSLVQFAVERSRLTGLALGRLGGAVAALDFLYLPRLHRAGFVANDNLPGQATTVSPGGYVLDSLPGLYDNVLLLDFKSLYPSIIRTFRIDPLGLAQPGEDPVEGFLGASFSREQAILPELIESLWKERDRAKQDSNAPLSQAIKIIMNSFYGVLGSGGCRFHEARLASSITRRGHEIIQRSHREIERIGLQVIYGDTDSLFVLLGEGIDDAAARARGMELAAHLNDWWREVIRKEHRLQSRLEVEFETHFLKFVMPTIRGTEKGSKKRYAGMVRADDGTTRMIFRGLETVRTDWTPLARRFQRELYRRIFAGEDYNEYIKTTLTDLESGRVDDELVYRKRLRRAVNDYTSNVPPHVQAARKLERPGRWISYVMSHEGPHPVELGAVSLDYDHYREKQLEPVADGLLHFLDTSFDKIAGAQFSLF